MAILDNVLRIMFEKNISQKELADYLGIRNYQVSEWKNGKTKSYMKHLDKIAEFLNVPLSELMRDRNDSPDLSRSGSSVADELTDLTQDELNEVRKYIEFIKSKRS